MSYTPSRPMGYGCLILSMSLVGAYVALTKPLAALLPVFLLAWLRFGIGAVAMLRWLKKPADEKPLSTQSRWLVFLESFLGNFLFTLCMITGVSMTNAVSAGVIMSSIPAVVAVMSWVFLKEKISLRVWGAVACGAIGIGLLSLAKDSHGAAAASGGQSAWLGNVLVQVSGRGPGRSSRALSWVQTLAAGRRRRFASCSARTFRTYGAPSKLER